MQPIKSAKDKFVRKYMKMAALLAEDVPCLSRGIGSVIVNPHTNTIISTEINGIAKGVPHADTYEFLKEFVHPKLTSDDIEYIAKVNTNASEYIRWTCPEDFAEHFAGCKNCPRKLVGAVSGDRLDLCNCVHSEANAVNNAAANGHSTHGCYLYAFCGTPCVTCAGAIINADIVRVYCLNEDSGAANNTYASYRSEWMFEKAGVELIKVDKEWIA